MSRSDVNRVKPLPFTSLRAIDSIVLKTRGCAKQSKNVFSLFTSRLFAKSGFSLAEVLIALGIISVLAAMTIPNLVKNYQKERYATQVKKVYTTLEQTVRRAEVDNGSYYSWDYGTLNQDGAEAEKFANTYLIPYMNVAKNCGRSTGCWKQPKYFDGTNAAYGDTANYSKFILNDGTAIHVATFGNRVVVHFDINGLKVPNIYGHDILLYHIRPNQKLGVVNYYLLDRDTLVNNSGNGCNKTSSQPDFCLALMLKDGWQIKDDYPWP